MLLVAVLGDRYNYITCAEGLYSMDHRYCVTAKECEAYKDRHNNEYHAYKELKMCVQV